MGGGNQQLYIKKLKVLGKGVFPLRAFHRKEEYDESKTAVSPGENVKADQLAGSLYNEK